jgi:hypothetical protein
MVLNEADKERTLLEPLADLIELTIHIEKQKTQSPDLENELSGKQEIVIPFLLHRIEEVLTM